MTKVIGYMRESVAELTKVKWPTRETTVQYTIVVLSSVVIMTGFLAGIDFLFTQLLDRVLL